MNTVFAGDSLSGKLFVHRLCTKKSLLSTSYPLCFPHSVENYTRVIHPQQVDNNVDN